VLRRFDLRQRRSSLIEYIRDLFHHGNAT
jgi:hypothetical protein